MSETPPLLRLVYASRSVAEGQAHLDELRDIAATARAHNAQQGITGVLLAAHAHYLQLLEGPRAAVETLFETLLLDPRHTEVELLRLEPASQRHFTAHATALVERNEAAGDIAERVRELRREPDARAADFVRLFSVPRVSKAARERMRGSHGGVVGVVFASPGGLWAASVVDQIARVAGERVGRTTITDLDADNARSLIEYADLSVDGVGAVRGVALTRPHPSVASLFERVALIVLVVTASDAADAPAHLREWADLPQVRRARPQVLVASSLAPERLNDLADALLAHTGLDVATVTIKPHDAAGVWAAAEQRLRAQVTEAAPLSTLAAPLSSLGAPFSTGAAALSTGAAALSAALSPSPPATPRPARPAGGEVQKPTLQALLALPGCRGALRFGIAPPRIIAVAGVVGDTRPLVLANWVEAQAALAERLGGGPLEDLVIDGRDERIVVRALAGGEFIAAFADPRGAPLPVLSAVLRGL